MILEGLDPIALTLSEHGEAIEAFEKSDRTRPPLGLTPGPSTALQSANSLGTGGQPPQAIAKAPYGRIPTNPETTKVPAGALSEIGQTPIPRYFFGNRR